MTTGTDLSVLANIIERMPGGFFIYRDDENLDLLYANDVVLEIFGCENMDDFKDLTGYNFKGMVHPDDFEKVQASISNQVSSNSKEMDRVEYRIVRKDGGIRWVEDFGRLDNTANYGKIFYVFILDITESHLAREENLRLEKVIGGLSVGFESIYLINLDDKMIRPYFLKNENFKTVTADLDLEDKEKFSWTKILSKYAENFVLPEDQELYLKKISPEIIKENLKDAPSFNINYRSKGKDGNIIYTEMYIARANTENPDDYIVVGFRDVTEHFSAKGKK